MTALEGLRETTLPGQTLFARGKVRDLYAVGHDRLLIVATDRISAFDAVLPTPIPDKGKVLNLLSAFWFRRTAETFPTTSSAPTPPPTPRPRGARGGPGRAEHAGAPHAADRRGVCRPGLPGRIGLERVPARRHRLRDPLPAGLRESEALPEPVFTPAIKAQSGHDENIPFGRLVQLVGATWPGACAGPPWTSTPRPRAVRPQRGIIIADTKMEFGLLPQPDGAPNSAPSGSETLLLIDELLTPDLALLGGRHLRGGRRPPATTSSTCATTWKGRAGTRSPRRPRCHRKWSPRPASGTSMPCAA